MIEALAFVGGGLGVAAIVTVMAFKWNGAERRAGDAAKKSALLDGEKKVLDANNTMLAKQNAEFAEQLKEAKERLDELEIMALQCAADMPVDGAFGRLLSGIAARRKTGSDHGDGGGAVLHEQPAEPADPDGLLDPWGQ